MKQLHNNIEAQNLLVEKVESWYKFMLDIKKDTTKVLSAKIGHISNKSVSVQITIEDSANVKHSVYVTPVSWWVKKLMKGQTYGNFSKKLVDNVDSCVASV